MSKPQVIFLLKALVTAACLWWLTRYFDFEQVRAALAGIDVRLLVVAITMHFLSFVAGGVRLCCCCGNRMHVMQQVGKNPVGILFSGKNRGL